MLTIPPPGFLRTIQAKYRIKSERNYREERERIIERETKSDRERERAIEREFSIGVTLRLTTWLTIPPPGFLFRAIQAKYRIKSERKNRGREREKER